MSDFRFEKHQVPASLVLSTGATRVGHFFVVSALTTHGGPERVGDLLNAEGGFFPFLHDDGTTGQYNRAHVAYVQLPTGMAEEELDPGYSVSKRCDVTMVLSTGTTLEGTVLVVGAPGHERLSDYVHGPRRFWYVITSRGTVIVNAAYVVELIENRVS
jgi:hypothetical protein